MQDNYIKMSQSFVVAVDEVDYREKLKPSAIMQYFQDLATSHALEIGIGYEEMKEQNLCWIMSRLSYRIVQYPMIGDTITVTTYPEMPQTVEANRGFYVHNQKGDIIILGRSKWCVLDIVTKRIKRADSMLNFKPEQYIPNPPFENSTPKLQSINDFDNISGNLNYDVKISDLDRYKHMNNARYGDTVLNSCSIEKLDNYNISAFDINFLAELKYGEQFSLKLADSFNETFFEAIRSDERPAFRAKIIWDKI